MKRATVEDIRKHDWFTAGCPTYLFPDRVTDTSIVDTDAIAEVSPDEFTLFHTVCAIRLARSLLLRNRRSMLLF